MLNFLAYRILLIFILAGILFILPNPELHTNRQVPNPDKKAAYWFVLHRKSNIEYLYNGLPGDIKNSKMIRNFQVKSGIPGERPTPLPQLLGRKYWLITAKTDSSDNPETAPYFLTLNVPVNEEEPYGPSPYLECSDPASVMSGVEGIQRGKQCNWILPGAFGLHGVAGDESRLSPENPGSSGCIRHMDKDISYLYNLLDPEKQEIRYYIEDK